MSFFNGDTSVSEQILNTSSFFNIDVDNNNTDVDATGVAATTRFQIEQKPLVFLNVDNNSDSFYSAYGDLSSTSIPAGYITKIFVKKTNTAHSINLKSTTLSIGSDFELKGGYFYTFVYNPGNLDANWYIDAVSSM